MATAIGYLLVGLQFATILLLISTFFWLRFFEVLWPRILGALLFATGLATMLAGIIQFHQANTQPMSILPSPNAEGNLVVEGIWSALRHPMYSSLLQLALGLCCWHQNWPVFIIWAGFLIVLFVKARYEETLLCEAFPLEYPAYRDATCMLVPLPCFFRYRRAPTAEPHQQDAPPPVSSSSSS